MKLTKIEKAGLEDEVLELAAAGKSSREIAAHLKVKGLDVTHTAVGRFLRSEAKGREVSRRAVSAERAHIVAGKAGEKALDHVEELNDAVRVLAGMVAHGYQTITLPDTAPVHVPLEARDRIQAARYLQTVAGFLIELAAGKPPSTDGKSLEAARAAIAEVFGYNVPADPNDPQEAPPTPEEHQPPVVH